MDTTNSNQKEIDEDLHMANQICMVTNKKNTQKKRLYLLGLLSLKPE